MPASAHQAVTSSASGPGPKPFVSPLGAAVGAILSTSQSPLVDDHAPAGIVAVANWSAAVTVVAEEELVFFSTDGAEPDTKTVKWRRNGARFPAPSCSSPASVCGPTPRAPVP